MGPKLPVGVFIDFESLVIYLTLVNLLLFYDREWKRGDVSYFILCLNKNKV